MMLLTMLGWWYTAGWAGQVRRAGDRTSRILEVFSVSLLAGSLFEPFRQISAGRVQGGGFDAQLRAFGDRLFSRLFGAVVRSLFICIGLVTACLAAVAGLVQVIVWPLLPVLPLVGGALMAAGVVL